MMSGVAMNQQALINRGQPEHTRYARRKRCTNWMGWRGYRSYAIEAEQWKITTTTPNLQQQQRRRRQHRSIKRRKSTNLYHKRKNICCYSGKKSDRSNQTGQQHCLLQAGWYAEGHTNASHNTPYDDSHRAQSLRRSHTHTHRGSGFAYDHMYIWTLHGRRTEEPIT